MKKDLHNVREDYQTGMLNEQEVENDPLKQFVLWFDQYQSLQTKDYNAMMLSTVDSNLHPNSRIVLLKAINKGGFEFFTNYNSRKSRQIASNNKVSLNFFWSALERQVLIRGEAYKTTADESDEYFATRPRGSQIGAWVSPQSEIIESREHLEDLVKQYEKRFSGEVPRPPHWGGYRVMPLEIEFWQGRSSRLHDRLLYTKGKAGNWDIKRLAP